MSEISPTGVLICVLNNRVAEFSNECVSAGVDYIEKSDFS